MTQEEAFKIVSDWINSAKTTEQRQYRKQVAFSALYNPNPEFAIDFAEALQNSPKE